MCRKRGRIVLVGVTGLELSRADFYEKELTLPGLLLLRPGPLRPELRGEGPGLSRRLRALDRAAQLRGRARHDGRRRAGRGAAGLAPLRDRRGRARPTTVLGGSEPSLGILLEYPGPMPMARPRGCERRTVTLPPAAGDRCRAERRAPVGCHRRGQLRRRGARSPPSRPAGARLAHGRVRRAASAACTPGASTASTRRPPTPTALLADAETDAVVDRHPPRQPRAASCCSALDGRQARVRREAAGADADELEQIDRRSQARAARPQPAADGRLQPPLRAAGA